MDEHLKALVLAKLAALEPPPLRLGCVDHGVDVARSLLKQAASARSIVVPIGRTIRKVVGGAGNVGAGLAEGLGVGEAGQGVARRVAQGAALAGGYSASRSTVNKGRQKVDEFRYRHGLY